MSRVLTIAAHPDDEILGLGGTIRKHVNEGDLAYCIILGEGMTSRKSSRADTEKAVIDSLHEDARQSAKIIGYKEVFLLIFRIIDLIPSIY